MRGIIGSLFGSLFGRKATPAPEVLHPVAASPPREVHSQGSSSSSSSQSTNSSSCSEPQDAPDVVHEAQSGPTGPLIGPPAGDAIDGDAEEGAQVLLMLAGGDSPAAAGGKAWMSMVSAVWPAAAGNKSVQALSIWQKLYYK